MKRKAFVLSRCSGEGEATDSLPARRHARAPLPAALALALGLLVPSMATAQQNVDGWDRLKWGMSEAEVHSAYGVRLKAAGYRYADTYGPYEVESTLAGYQFDAIPQFGLTTKRLEKVFLASKGGGAVKVAAVRSQLLRLYGNPTRFDGRDVWNLKTTVVEFDPITVLGVEVVGVHFCSRAFVARRTPPRCKG